MLPFLLPVLLPWVLGLLQGPGPSPAQARPARWTWDGFPAFVWRENPVPPPPGSLEPFGGVLVLRGEDPRWAHARGLATLVWNAAGRDALHRDANADWRARVEHWIATRDPADLVREPCLSDPAVVQHLSDTLEATLARPGNASALGLVLGDEVALTPDGAPFDLCRGPHCEAAWREWAAARGWPELAPSTDQARHALLQGDEPLVAAWLARRRFDRERLSARLEALAARTRAAGFPAALLGCAGTSAFGALDLAALEGFAISETYARGDARLVEQRRPDARWLTTLFLDQETPDGSAWLTFAHWARGGRGLVLWSERDLLEPARRTRLLRALADVRALARRPELRVEPPSGTLAIVHDPDSIAAGWLREHQGQSDWPRHLPSEERRTGAFPRKVERWQRALARRAREPLGVTLEAGDDARREAVRLLVLVESLVLDEADLRRLEAHLERGGALAVDGPLGWIDRRGRPWDESCLERLRRRAPGRVLVRDSDALGLDGAWLGHLEAAAGLAPLPLPVVRGAPGRLPWRITARRVLGEGVVDDGQWRVTLLPDLETPGERARGLGAVGLELVPPEGWRMRWVHPLGGGGEGGTGRVLAAGDGAVVVLERD